MTQPNDGAASAAESDDRARVRQITRHVLRAIHSDVRYGASSPGVREGVREACDTARACGLHVEELLVIVKQCWRDVSDAEFLEAGGASSADVFAPSFGKQARTDEALTEVITMCIREFYRPDARH